MDVCVYVGTAAAGRVHTCMCVCACGYALLMAGAYMRVCVYGLAQINLAIEVDERRGIFSACGTLRRTRRVISADSSAATETSPHRVSVLSLSSGSHLELRVQLPFCGIWGLRRPGAAGGSLFGGTWTVTASRSSVGSLLPSLRLEACFRGC